MCALERTRGGLGHLAVPGAETPRGGDDAAVGAAAVGARRGRGGAAHVARANERGVHGDGRFWLRPRAGGSGNSSADQTLNNRKGRPVVWLGALDDDKSFTTGGRTVPRERNSVSRRPAHRRGARREDARADSNLGFQTSAMSGESARLRANAEEQVTRLLTQLSDLEEYRDELDDDEYEEMRADTLTQLEEFKASLARMVAGDVTLLNELESIRVRPFPPRPTPACEPVPVERPRRVPVRRPQSNHPRRASRPRPPVPAFAP